MCILGQAGQGILFDHATGIVIGETAVVANDVSVLQDVTLGGTGRQWFASSQHWRGRDDWCQCKNSGSYQVGQGAKIGAGSVVLHSVPAHTM